MSTQSESLNAVFREVFDEPDPCARERMIEDILREHHTVFTRLARELVLRFNIEDDWADDVRQIVRTAAWEYLREPLKPGFEVSATIPCIRRAARAEVQRMRQSTAYTGVSGAVSARRRQSAISKHRMDLIRTLGYEPDDQSVIDSYNEKVISVRGLDRARRQGALVSREDLTLPVTDILDLAVGVASDDDWVSQVELQGLVVEIIRRCWELGEATGRAAQVMLGQEVLDTADRVACPGDGVPTACAGAALQRVRAVAVQAIDEWGITFGC